MPIASRSNHDRSYRQHRHATAASAAGGRLAEHEVVADVGVEVPLTGAATGVAIIAKGAIVELHVAVVVAAGRDVVGLARGSAIAEVQAEIPEGL